MPQEIATIALPRPDFRARAPWWGADLQTLRNHMAARPADLTTWPQSDRLLAMADGSGDRLVASLQTPAVVTGPLVVLIHGLTGCADSGYLRASARHLLMKGFPVLRLNLRGAGASRPHCKGQYNAGLSADLRDALTALKQADPDLLQGGVVPVGYSLGANMLLKFLGEGEFPVPVRAAASVSAPIDLKSAQLRIMAPRNALYHGYLLRRMKAECRAAPVPPDAETLRTLDRLRTLYQFDDRIVAPRGGFAGAEDYYARSSARRYLARITVPTLVIHAQDDPWIPFAAYRAVDWPANPRLRPLFPKGGGHVGFHDRGGPPAWHDRTMAEFLKAVL